MGDIAECIDDSNARQEERREMIFIAEVGSPPRADTMHASCLDCWAFLAAGSYLVGHVSGWRRFHASPAVWRTLEWSERH